uniref:Macaca fascicularis brain cDNA clone: QflA-23429, similar to human attractin (ATRN), transcript variant 1, mRNA, RefSeq: NM_139321.1 n=1 Tax=Macaca fascicularis TaxID=9541 RepID=I7GIX4_MACFA|nr:unnamed protein product [Macaca fascicularis]
MSPWRIRHTLNSCVPPAVPAHSLGISLRLPVWREGNPRSPELTRRKGSSRQKTVSRRKVLDYPWVRPAIQDRRHLGNKKSRALPVGRGILPSSANPAPLI